VLTTLDAPSLIALAGTLVAALLGDHREPHRPTGRATHVGNRGGGGRRTSRAASPSTAATSSDGCRASTPCSPRRTSREQQKRLVIDASHELRTPLTALRTNIDVLRRTDGLEPTQHAELLADVQIELEELTDLVTELVDLATDARRRAARTGRARRSPSEWSGARRRTSEISFAVETPRRRHT
jgi:two-component system sensor histidine kinase MprB